MVVVSENMTPIQLWDLVMKHYGVYEECTRALETAKPDSTVASKKDYTDKKFDQATAVAAAVEALSRLSNAEARRQLLKFDRDSNGENAPVAISHQDNLLSQFAPAFWTHCFLHLFFRGDCIERDRRRVTQPLKPASWATKWAKCLITRADIRDWRMSVDFVACLYNILLRRSQMQSVQVEILKIGPQEAEQLSQVTAQDLMSCAVASGECETLRAILKKKGLDEKLFATLRRMQAAQRNVRGSEASKANIRNLFTAMRVWTGCSSLFFTLNPYAFRMFS